MATLKSLKADVSGVRPSSERSSNDKYRLGNDKWSERNFVCQTQVCDLIDMNTIYQTLIESSSLSLSLIYELYVFIPGWRCRTHKLLIKARFRPILLLRRLIRCLIHFGWITLRWKLVNYFRFLGFRRCFQCRTRPKPESALTMAL